MKLPTTVQVGPYKFKVVKNKHEFDEISAKHSDKDTRLYGFMDGDSQTIYVDPTCGPDVQVDTLLHELLHAVIFTANKEWDDEEEIVSTMSTPLLDLLRRNPRLVEALVDK